LNDTVLVSGTVVVDAFERACVATSGVGVVEDMVVGIEDGLWDADYCGAITTGVAKLFIQVCVSMRAGRFFFFRLGLLEVTYFAYELVFLFDKAVSAVEVPVM